MPRLIIFIILTLFNFKISFASEKNEIKCKWANKSKVTCIEITSLIIHQTFLSQE